MDLIYLMQREMFRRRYSHNSIKAYSDCVRKFLKYCRKEPRWINRADIKNYLDYLSSRQLSASSMNQSLMAIKFALEQILNKKWYFIKLPYSKKPQKNPEVLSKDEVKKLLSAIRNPKHNLMIRLLYSSGLRVSELIKLRARDLDILHGIGWVRSGKGNKDRLFIIAESIRQELSQYLKDNSIDNGSFIFKGIGSHIHPRTIQEIIKNSAKLAEINKNVHPHTLRHSFATHLIENGYDVNSVQSLLGHNSSETTMIYIHMASAKMINVKSPLDTL